MNIHRISVWMISKMYSLVNNLCNIIFNWNNRILIRLVTLKNQWRNLILNLLRKIYLLLKSYWTSVGISWRIDRIQRKKKLWIIISKNFWKMMLLTRQLFIINLKKQSNVSSLEIIFKKIRFKMLKLRRKRKNKVICFLK